MPLRGDGARRLVARDQEQQEEEVELLGRELAAVELDVDERGGEVVARDRASAFSRSFAAYMNICAESCMFASFSLALISGVLPSCNSGSSNPTILLPIS